MSTPTNSENSRNPKPPLKLRPMPLITIVNYKGTMDPQMWYLHSQMGLYLRNLEVHMINSTKLLDLKSVLNKIM